jgi:putative DNA primase/helicase
VVDNVDVSDPSGQADAGRDPTSASGGTAAAPGALSPQAEVVSLADAKRRKVHGAAEVHDAASDAADEARPPQSSGRRKRDRGADLGRYVEMMEVGPALILGTDTCFIEAYREIWRISAVAHAFGSDAVREFKESLDRWTVRQTAVVFDPTGTCRKPEWANLFGGFDIKRRTGDPGPFLDLVRYLTSRASPNADDCDEIQHKLQQWMAYQLQNRGAKINHAIVMHGDEGSGKSILWEQIFMPMHAPYGRLIGQSELEDKFNDVFSKCTFVLADEVCARSELVHNKNKLKPLQTSRTIQINPKGLPRREERNHMNFVFLSNELQPLALDNSDRRYFVIATPPARERAFYQRINAWLAAGGVEIAYDYLMSYPLDDFDPYAPPPITQAKQELIELGLKSAERFWIEWAAGELGLPYRTCSAAQAYRAYQRYASRTGDRFPAQEGPFSRMVFRISEARADQMSVTPVHPGKASWDEAGRRRTYRLFLVTEPPEQVSMGAWARECVEQFEQELQRYLGPSASRSLGGETSGGDA